MLTITVTYPDAAALIAGRTKREVAAIVEANAATLTDADRAAIAAALVERDARKGR